MIPLLYYNQSSVDLLCVVKETFATLFAEPASRDHAAEQD